MGVRDRADQAHDATERLLRHYLGRKEIRWTWWQLGITGEPQFDLRYPTYLNATHSVFWRPSEPSEHSTIKIDREASRAIRTGPPWFIASHPAVDFSSAPPWSIGSFRPGPDPLKPWPCWSPVALKETWPVFLLDRPAVTVVAELIRLHHDDVVRMLRHVGLLPFESKPPGQLELNLQKKVFATPEPKPGTVLEPEPFPNRHHIRRPDPDEKCWAWIEDAMKVVPRPSTKKMASAWFEMLHEASGEKWKAGTIRREYYRRPKRA
jgi:hypothetical protein